MPSDIPDEIRSTYLTLTEDQRAFVDAYVDDAVSGYDAVRHCFAHFEPFEAHEVAQRLLASERIRAAIAERSALRHDQGAASSMWLVRRLVDYANVDLSEIMTESGRLLSPHCWPLDLRRMVRKIRLDPVTGEVVDVTFESKAKVLEMIGRADSVGTFDRENDGGRDTLVIVRDMTAPQRGPSSGASDAVDAVDAGCTVVDVPCDEALSLGGG